MTEHQSMHVPHANKHRIFDWVQTESGCENVVVSPEEVAGTYGVRESLLIKHIDRQINDEQDVLSLPWAIALLILFAFMNIAHEQMALQRSLEWAIDQDIIENANFAFSAPGYMGHK